MKRELSVRVLHASPAKYSRTPPCPSVTADTLSVVGSLWIAAICRCSDAGANDAHSM